MCAHVPAAHVFAEGRDIDGREASGECGLAGILTCRGSTLEKSPENQVVLDKGYTSDLASDLPQSPPGRLFLFFWFLARLQKRYDLFEMRLDRGAFFTGEMPREDL